MKKFFVVLVLVFISLTDITLAESQNCKTAKLYGISLLGCVRGADLVTQGQGVCSNVPDVIYTLMALEPGGQLFVDLFEANGFRRLCISICTQAVTMKINDGTYMPLAKNIQRTTNLTLSKFNCTSRFTDEEFKEAMK